MSVLFGPSANENDAATTATVANLFAFFISLFVGGNDSVALELPTHIRHGQTRPWLEGRRCCWVLKKAKPPCECWLSWLSVFAWDRTAKAAPLHQDDDEWWSFV